MHTFNLNFFFINKNFNCAANGEKISIYLNLIKMSRRVKCLQVGQFNPAATDTPAAVAAEIKGKLQILSQ